MNFRPDADPGQRHDPLEGLDASGIIVTGASRDRLVPAFTPVLDAVVEGVQNAGEDVSLYVYGSVATGMARSPSSDVDLVAIGLPKSEGIALRQQLSHQFRDVCRGVGLGTAKPTDYVGEHDKAYGNRVFLRHYGVHLTGPDPRASLPDFPGDARAARGFNGDVARGADRWRAQLEEGDDPALVSHRIGRKCIFAVTGLVSIHDGIWTTERNKGAERWGEIVPDLADDLQMLLTWSRGKGDPSRETVATALDGVVSRIADDFESQIGLWAT